MLSSDLIEIFFRRGGVIPARKLLPLDRKFCGECGHDLTVKSRKSPVDYSQPQSYTPKFLADKILTTRSSIEGERKLVTVLFADVANYTAMAEKLFREIMMYYWLNKTQEIVESFQT